jgi:hypothetical protein
MRRGTKCVGENQFFKEGVFKLQYHPADKNNRMYWCGCSKWVRIGKRWKICIVPGRFRGKKIKLDGSKRFTR